MRCAGTLKPKPPIPGRLKRVVFRIGLVLVGLLLLVYVVHIAIRVRWDIGLVSARKGYYAYNEQNYESAFKHLDRAHKWVPWDEEFSFWLAATQTHRGMYEKSLEVLARLSSNAQVYNARGVNYFLSGNLQAAEDDYRKAIASDNRLEYHYHLSLALKAAGKMREYRAQDGFLKTLGHGDTRDWREPRLPSAPVANPAPAESSVPVASNGPNRL